MLYRVAPGKDPKPMIFGGQHRHSRIVRAEEPRQAALLALKAIEAEGQHPTPKMVYVYDLTVPPGKGVVTEAPQAPFQYRVSELLEWAAVFCSEGVS